jgi:hypothetical protein
MQVRPSWKGVIGSGLWTAVSVMALLSDVAAWLWVLQVALGEVGAAATPSAISLLACLAHRPATDATAAEASAASALCALMRVVTRTLSMGR